MGVYGTPRSASGMSATMMSALKMTALRMALCGLCEAHDVERRNGRERDHQHRGDDGEVFGDVVGDAEGGERAARDEELLPDFDDLDELGRIAVEIHHVAGLAGGLGAGVHGHADVGLGQRGRVVGAVAGHGDEMAGRLFVADALQLLFRRGLGHEVVHARLGGDGGGGQRVVAGDHHGADAHLAQMREALLDAAFDHVLELHHAEDLAAFGDDQRRAAGARDLIHGLADGLRKRAAQLVHIDAHGVGRAFADARAVAPLPGSPRRSCASAR